MKKATLIIIGLLMAAGVAKAQSLDSIAHFQLDLVSGSMVAQPDNLMQLNDSNVMLHVGYYGYENPFNQWGVGHMYYKISRHGAELLDSVYYEDADTHCFMFTRHPKSGKMLRVSIIHDSISQESSLQIVPFNNDLSFDFSDEITVHLSDANVRNQWDSYLVNNYDELAVHYAIRETFLTEIHHFALIDFDGTLKHQNSFVQELASPYDVMMNLGVFNESPLEYYHSGEILVSSGTSNETVFACHVLDSLFQPKDTIMIHKQIDFNTSYSFGWHENIVLDGDDLLLSARYVKLSGKTGVCVAKYDKQTLDIRKSVFFESYPNYVDGACPIKLAKSNDGGYYYAYSTQNPWVYDLGQIAVVKMDADLNIQWQRFCLEPEGYGRDGYVLEVFDDGGVAVSGVIYRHNELFLLILNDDGNVGTPETETFIRPYVYYPNPAQTELHLQYSPDVTPKIIELYDLQGRLVRTQCNGLESLNLQGLSAGQYVMKVTLENGKVFSDKVVKE